MRHYEINIAKMCKEKDWRGLPAHAFYARVQLDDNVIQEDAEREFHRLKLTYPWPEYHLTLRYVEEVVSVQTSLSNAPEDFLDQHGWSYTSTAPKES